MKSESANEIMTNKQSARLSDLLKPKPQSKFGDVETELRHFSIITFAVDPKVLERHLHPRFRPFLVYFNGREQALVSMVPFYDSDFYVVGLDWFKFSFGQTNYRAYVIDRITGENCVWFFGTSLDSAFNVIPRYCWKLPWHKARISFDCVYDTTTSCYHRYRLETQSDWAPLSLELKDNGIEPKTLAGFDDLEVALGVLTHPLTGYFFRRDGRLGTYSIWHEKLDMTQGSLVSGDVALFNRLGFLSNIAGQLHSVLIQRSIRFQIQLPPKVCLG